MKGITAPLVIYKALQEFTNNCTGEFCQSQKSHSFFLFLTSLTILLTPSSVTSSAVPSPDGSSFENKFCPWRSVQMCVCECRPVARGTIPGSILFHAAAGLSDEAIVATVTLWGVPVCRGGHSRANEHASESQEWELAVQKVCSCVCVWASVC